MGTTSPNNLQLNISVTYANAAQSIERLKESIESLKRTASAPMEVVFDFKSVSKGIKDSLATIRNEVKGLGKDSDFGSIAKNIQRELNKTVRDVNKMNKDFGNVFGKDFNKNVEEAIKNADALVQKEKDIEAQSVQTEKNIAKAQERNNELLAKNNELKKKNGQLSRENAKIEKASQEQPQQSKPTKSKPTKDKSTNVVIEDGISGDSGVVGNLKKGRRRGTGGGTQQVNTTLQDVADVNKVIEKASKSASDASSKATAQVTESVQQTVKKTTDGANQVNNVVTTAVNTLSSESKKAAKSIVELTVAIQNLITAASRHTNIKPMKNMNYSGTMKNTPVKIDMESLAKALNNIKPQLSPTEQLLRKRDSVINSLENPGSIPRKKSYDKRIEELEKLNSQLSSVEHGSLTRKYPSNYFSPSNGENYYKDYIKDISGFNALQKEMNGLIEQGIVPTQKRWDIEKKRFEGIKNSILNTKAEGLNKEFLKSLGDPTGGSYENFVNMIKNHHGTNSLASSIKLNTSEVNGQIMQIVEKLEALKAKGNIPITFNLESFNAAVARVNSTIANLRQNGSEIPLRANTATLMTQLSRISEMGSRIQLPITLTVANAKTVIAEIETVLAKTKEIANLAISVPIKADLTVFYKDLETLKSRLDTLYNTKKYFNPKIIADTSDFKNKLKVLKDRLIQFQRGKYTSIKIKADLSAFKKAMADFTSSINSNGLSQGKVVTITADNKQFLAVVDESLKKLQELKDVTVHINSNVKDVVSKAKESKEKSSFNSDKWDINQAKFFEYKDIPESKFLENRLEEKKLGKTGFWNLTDYADYSAMAKEQSRILEEAAEAAHSAKDLARKVTHRENTAKANAQAKASESEGMTELSPLAEWAVRNRGYNAQSFYNGTLTDADLKRQFRQDNDIEAMSMAKQKAEDIRRITGLVKEQVAAEKERRAVLDEEANTRSAIARNNYKQMEIDAERTLTNQVKEKFKLEGELQNQNSKNMSLADAQRKHQEEQAKREAQAHKENLAFLDKEARAKELYNQLLEKQNRLLTYGKTLTQKQVDTQRDAITKARASMERMGFDASGLGRSNMELLGWDKNTINRAITDYNTQSWNRSNVQSYSNTMAQLRRDQEMYFNTMSKYPSKNNIANLATVTARIKNMNQEMAKFANYTNKTDKTMESIKNKFSNHLSWMTTGIAIGSFFAIPAETLATWQDLEFRLAGIQQVIPSIEENIGKSAFKEAFELVEIAKKYGESIEGTMEAAKSIGRMYGKDATDKDGNIIEGSGVANTNLITAQAAKMAVADAFDMENAFKGLEAALSQWNLQTEDTGKLLVNTNRILEAWTIAAHAGAASAQDIGQAIEIAGTAAHSAGISFEFFNALVATGVRQTARSGNEIGQAIKSMMVSMQSDKSLKALQEWGIEIYNIGEDGTKSMRSFEDIILDVSLMMNNTEKDTRRLLMTLSGGRPILASRSGNVA